MMLKTLLHFNKRACRFFVCINVCCFSLTVTSSSAQINYSAEDSARIKQLLDAAKQLTNISRFDSALTICNNAIEICKEKKYLRGEAYALLQLSDVHYRQSKYSFSGNNDSAALAIGLTLKDTFIIASSYNQLGQLFMEKGRKTTALELFNSVLKMGFDKKQTKLTAEVYNNIGYITSEWENAVEWYLKALRIYDELKDTVSSAKIFSNLAAAMYDLKKFDKAIEYQQRCITIRESTHDKNGLAEAYSNIAQFYLGLDSLDLVEKYLALGMSNAQASGSKLLMAQAYVVQVLYYNHQRDNKQALVNELKAIELAEQAGDPDFLSRRYISAGALYGAINDKKKELEYLQKAIEISKQTGNKMNLRDGYMFLTVHYKLNKEWENAFTNMKNYIAYRDSINSEGTESKIADLEAKYGVEKKDHEIEMLNVDRQLKESKIAKQHSEKNILIIIVIALFIIAGAVFWLYRLNNLRRQERQRFEFTSQLKDLEMQALRSQMNPHFLFNCLNSIQRFILENDNKNALTYLTKFARLVRLILENSRDKKVSLSKEIESLDLYIQMEKLRFDYNFSYSIVVNETINKEDTQITPMLLQPFVENAIWHGLQHKESDGKISVHVSEKHNVLAFIIEDNGIGRKASAEINRHLQNHTSVGLQITEKRIEMLSNSNQVGTVNIIDLYGENGKAKGTKVEINLPLD